MGTGRARTPEEQIRIRISRVEQDIYYEIRRKKMNIEKILKLREELLLLKAGKIIPIRDEVKGTWKWEESRE